MNRTISALLLAFPIALGACASGTAMFTPSKLNRTSDDKDGSVQRIEFPGPDPMISRERIEPINLLFMLDPTGAARELYEKSGGTKQWKEITIDEKYEWGFHAFYSPKNDLSDIKNRRNRIQDRLVISSDQRCGIYKRVIHQVAADSSYWSGSVATVSGVLGSLLGGNAARNLAAISGISSGIGAEFSQAYYSNLASNVITKGIEERRKSILGRIAAAQKAEISGYTVQAAIKDAVFYDMQCSIIAGLEEAQDAIRLAADPGIDAANRIIAKQKFTVELLDGNVETVKRLMTEYATLQSSSLLGGDRFSNVGVVTVAAHTGLPTVYADYYSAHEINPVTAEQAFRTRIGKIYQSDPAAKIGALKLEDQGNPPAPVGALKDFIALNGAYKNTYDTCWPALHHSYLNQRTIVEKAATQIARDMAEIDANATLKRMETVKEFLTLRKSQIDGLLNEYFKQGPAVLFDGVLDGSKKDGQGNPLPAKLRSLEVVDSTTGKTRLRARADEIAENLKGLCP